MTLSSRRVTKFASALVVAVMLFAPAGAASADPSTDGFWYFDAYHIEDAHASGLTGKGVTIAVFDTQINLDVPTLHGADIEVQPSTCYDDAGALIPPTSTDLAADHGTNVVSYLVGSGKGYSGEPGVKGIVPDAKILYNLFGAKVGETSNGIELSCNAKEGGELYTSVAQGIYSAIDAGADIISMSVNMSANPEAELALAHALNAGVVVIASVDNDSFAGGPFGTFPSGMNGVVGVQSMDANVEIQGGHSDPFGDVVGPGVDVVWQGDGTWEQQKYARGTSIATPIVAGFVALVAQKYPDASGGQLVQTLIRNTGTEDHPLTFDAEFAFGYGVASATRMLAVDPTQYDDVNPLISNDPDAVPSASVIANPPSTVNEYLGGEPSATATNDAIAPSAAGVPLAPVILGALGLLLVAAVIVILVLIAVRRSRSSADPPHRTSA